MAQTEEYLPGISWAELQTVLLSLADTPVKKNDGAPSGRRDPQTGGLPLSGSHLPGDPAHRGGLAGFRFPAAGVGHDVLGRIVFVLTIATIAALVVTSVIGAERFAFALQGIRYGS